MTANGGIRVAVTVVIQMTEEQKETYASSYGLAVRSKAIVDDVRGNILTVVQGMACFEDIEVSLG